MSLNKETNPNQIIHWLKLPLVHYITLIKECENLFV